MLTLLHGNTDDIAPAVQVLHVARDGRHGRHFMVFRVDAKAHSVDVLRVLHDSMDLARHAPREGDSGVDSDIGPA